MTRIHLQVAPASVESPSHNLPYYVFLTASDIDKRLVMRIISTTQLNDVKNATQARSCFAFIMHTRKYLIARFIQYFDISISK